MARDTFDRLMRLPTWPTEWAFHMIFMAHVDWMQTGDRAWLSARYESLKPKLLLDRARADGLLQGTPAQVGRGDIVDWPPGERDGFVFRPVNTVVNAFHLRSLALMADLAAALGKDREAGEYASRERATRRAFQEALFDAGRGLFRDGEGTDHASLHANLFPLGFGLVPPERQHAVVHWVAGRGMRARSMPRSTCSRRCRARRGRPRPELYGPNHHWTHMLDSGTTITREAGPEVRPNQTGTTPGRRPANLPPRHARSPAAVPGRAPSGWHPGALRHAGGRIPTPRGPVAIRWEKGERFRMHLGLPRGTTAQVRLHAAEGTTAVWVDGRPVAASREGAWWTLAKDVGGSVQLEVR
jgi:hypothetical protein